MTPAQSKIKDWRENPCKFVYDAFGVEPDKWQEKVLKAFASNDPITRRISMQACAGPGKSAVLAWAGWNFLSCYGSPGHHPKGVAISVTRENLADNLWAEFAKWQGINKERNGYLHSYFTWNSERIYANDHKKTWFLSARTYKQSANPEEKGRTLSGLHSKYVCYLIDESGDIDPSVLKSAEQGLGNCEFGKILQAGNPTSTSGMLYFAFKEQSHLWFIVRITGDPDDPNRSPRIDIDWARTMIAAYGRHDPWVMSYILGLFPPGSINSLFSPDDILSSINKNYLPEAYSFAQKRIGIDVARFGGDSTVLFPRQGLKLFPPTVMRGADGPTIGSKLINGKLKWGSEAEFIDDTGGYGASVIDYVRGHGFTPTGVNSSAAPDDERFYNKRAEMYWRFSQWVKRGGQLPDIPELKRELPQIEYGFKNSKLLVVPKDVIKKKLNGHSPDHSDAASLTFATEDRPAKMDIEYKKLVKIESEWDPFQD